jgi:solute:Na+ symporter, SSS family
MSLLRHLCLILIAFATTLAQASGGSVAGASLRTDVPVAAPAEARSLATQGSTLFALGNTHVHVLPAGATTWTDTGVWRESTLTHDPVLATASSTEGVFIVTPSAITRLQWAAGRFTISELPQPPRNFTVVTAAVLERKLHLVADSGAWSLDLTAPVPTWIDLPAPPASVVAGSVLIDQLEQLTLFTPAATCVYASRSGWKSTAAAAAPFPLTAATPVARYGVAHIFFFTPSVTHSYHVATEKWTTYDPVFTNSAAVSVAPLNGKISALTLSPAPTVSGVTAQALPTGYNWMDHSVVGLYLLAMVGMSLWFARRKQNSNDYFRGGNRIPWWVSGMSLFATFASGISMMAMPGKAFSGDWTYFSQSIFALLVLPVSLFVLAPLVRRLKIPTANAYLERRFGLSARMLASTIAVFTVSLARQGSVLVLPSIALSTVMGVDVLTCILVMGLVTLAYTFFGGLEAVVWTDTVQGFIMIGAVVGCLLLAWSRIDLAPGEAWSLLQSSDKLYTFDWNWDLTYPTAWIFLITTVIGTLGGVANQDYIQRVQCTPDLRQARLAIATQLLVAVPLNLLLFGLGTVLFLFYRQHPESLSPAMKLDGIYPFFVAQQLPPGVSGLVVAALLAATMSTISSCNCSVSDILTQDFYKRFKPAATDRSVLRFGRLMTLASGFAGIGTAVWMATATMGSIWDLATMLTNLIGNGVVGLFTLGLLTRRAHQTGALLGVICGMAVVWFLQRDGTVTFWLYTAVGTTVTVTVGYLASLILPGRIPALDGLTLFTLKNQSSSS